MDDDIFPYLGLKIQITTMVINLETSTHLFQSQFTLAIDSPLCTKNGTICWTNWATDNTNNYPGAMDSFKQLCHRKNCKYY